MIACWRFTTIFRTLPHACLITVYVCKRDKYNPSRYGHGNTNMAVIWHDLVYLECLFHVCFLSTVLAFYLWTMGSLLFCTYVHRIQKYMDRETWTRYCFRRVLVWFGLWTVYRSLCTSHNATWTHHRFSEPVLPNYFLCARSHNLYSELILTSNYG